MNITLMSELAVVLASFIASASCAAVVWACLGRELRRRLGRPEGTVVALGVTLLTLGATWIVAIWILRTSGVLPPAPEAGFPWLAFAVSAAMVGASIHVAPKRSGRT